MDAYKVRFNGVAVNVVEAFLNHMEIPLEYKDSFGMAGFSDSYLSVDDNDAFYTHSSKQLVLPELSKAPVGATHFNMYSGIYIMHNQANDGDGFHVYEYVSGTWNHRYKTKGVKATAEHILPLRSLTKVEEPVQEFSHYVRHFKGVKLDAYRIFVLFGITDPCIQHSIKKLLALGKRGAKDEMKDAMEVIKTMERWVEMQKEV